MYRITSRARHDYESRRWLQVSSGINAILESGIKSSTNILVNTVFFRLVVCELSTHVIKIANETVAVLKRSTSNQFDWLFYSREFSFLDKQPEKHSSY